jgi:hypothetical protein
MAASDNRSIQGLQAAALGVITLLVPAALTYVLTVIGTSRWDDAYKIPILATVSVIGLIVLLTLIVVIFQALGLADKTQALALPDGSIRALIAFSLIAIFGVVYVFIYTRMSRDPIQHLGPMPLLDAQHIQAMLKDAVLTPGPAGTATVNYHSDPTANDFAKQGFTALITLITSVISFYFGAATAISAAGSAPSGVTLVSFVAPPSIPAGQSGQGTVTLSGPAPAPGGATVQFTTTPVSGVVSVPASLLIPAGAATAHFNVTADASAQGKSATITAAYGKSSQSATVNVT